MTNELRQTVNAQEQSHKYEIDRATAANEASLLEINKLYSDKAILVNQSADLQAQFETSRLQYEQACSETREQLNTLSQQKQWDASSYEMVIQELRDRYTQNEAETSASFLQGNTTIQELQSKNERLVAELENAQKLLDAQTGQLTIVNLQCNSQQEEIGTLHNDVESYKINLENMTTQIIMLNEEAERNSIIMDEVFTTNNNTQELFLEFIKMGALKSNCRDSANSSDNDERLDSFRIAKRAGRAIKLSRQSRENDPPINDSPTIDSMRDNDTGTGAGFGRERLTTPATGSTPRSGVAYEKNTPVGLPQESTTQDNLTPIHVDSTPIIEKISTIRRSHCPSHDVDSHRLKNEMPLKTLSFFWRIYMY